MSLSLDEDLIAFHPAIPTKSNGLCSFSLFQTTLV
jgi:hypothetical protein